MRGGGGGDRGDLRTHQVEPQEKVGAQNSIRALGTVHIHLFQITGLDSGHPRRPIPRRVSGRHPVDGGRGGGGQVEGNRGHGF